MNFSDTTYPFLRDDCIALFDFEKGTNIFNETEKLFNELLNKADYRNNEAIKDHFQRKLYPLMAFYKTLLSSGYSKEDALEFAENESEKVAMVKKKDNEKMIKLPFAYLMYRLGVKSHMKNNFPLEGWDIEWVCNNNKEIHFNLTRCIYHDLTTLNDCPELCKVYCKNDIIAFSGLMPKIRFEREFTLGTGGDYCDFHFVNHK